MSREEALIALRRSVTVLGDSCLEGRLASAALEILERHDEMGGQEGFAPYCAACHRWCPCPDANTIIGAVLTE